MAMTRVMIMVMMSNATAAPQILNRPKRQAYGNPLSPSIANLRQRVSTYFMPCHDCEHEHIPPPESGTAGTSLFQQIDHAGIIALNELRPKSAMAIVRSYAHRLDTTPLCESDADEELIITIPFTALARLHSVLLRSPIGDRAPRTVKLYKNLPGLDFDSASSTKPVQQLDYPENVGIGTSENDGIVEFALARAHWAGTTSLTLYISANYGANTSALSYIGVRGDWQPLNQAPVVALYEAAADPRDHPISERADVGGARSTF